MVFVFLVERAKAIHFSVTDNSVLIGIVTRDITKTWIVVMCVHMIWFRKYVKAPRTATKLSMEL